MKFLHFVLSLCLMCLFMGALTKAAPMPTLPGAPPTPPSGNGATTDYTGPPTDPPTAVTGGPPIVTVTSIYGA